MKKTRKDSPLKSYSDLKGKECEKGVGGLNSVWSSKRKQTNLMA